MTTTLDYMIYDAILADSEVVSLTCGRIRSTCFEVSPTEQDNTPLPYVIVTDDGLQSDPGTKDFEWEGDYDSVSVGVEVAADSPAAVRSLRQKVRQAIERYMQDAAVDGDVTLLSVQTEGIAWDWMKPCYYDRIHYACEIPNHLDE